MKVQCIHQKTQCRLQDREEERETVCDQQEKSPLSSRDRDNPGIVFHESISNKK